MYARVLASDATFNGRFFTGVLSTGIYCLPSCPARKPKAENVRFFPSCEAARAAGLRPCRKCHPDDFARGADPVLEAIEALVAELREQPGCFPDTGALVRRSGFGATRFFELVRLYYHTSPAELLVRARLEAAKRRLLERDEGLLAVAPEIGFESLSAFHAQFRRRNGLSPGEYRALAHSRSFSLTLPPDYALAYLRRALSRDPRSVSERLEGGVYTAAVRLAGGPTTLQLEFAGRAVHVSLPVAAIDPVPPRRDGSGPPRLPPAAEAHALVVGLLGLDQDAPGFARLAHKLGLDRLVTGRPGLRISQTWSVYEGLLWSVIGQQINFPLACQLRRRLFERAGTPVGAGLVAPPTPAAVAALQPADLQSLQFSRQKAEYLIGLSRQVAAGTLDLDQLRLQSAPRVTRTLLALRGLGPWSVNYLMMRSLGFADCVPLGDTGLTSGLRALLRLEAQPDTDATRRLMRAFSPYRSLATTHLWQFTQPPPA